jgi:hypothetical protein
MNKSIPIILLFFTLPVWSKNLPIKASFRLAMASFTSSSNNSVGSTGGSYQNTGAPDFSIHYFFNPQLSVGLGLDLFTSKATSNLDLWGLRVLSRYYFSGNGIAERIKSYNLKSSNLTKWAYYVGGELKRYTYFIGSNPSEVKDYELSGTYVNMNAMIGVDYRLNHSYELNAEFNNTISSFASTDNRILADARIIYFGGSYLW